MHYIIYIMYKNRDDDDGTLPRIVTKNKKNDCTNERMNDLMNED